MKSTKTILANIESNSWQIGKAIDKQKYYSREQFIADVKNYIKAIKEGRMINVIHYVSSSGMSRVISFHSCEKNKKSNSHYYRQYVSLFRALGYSKGNNDYNFRVTGCGMDMIFHTNYTNIHLFKKLGFLTDAECSKLCQMTPSTL